MEAELDLHHHGDTAISGAVLGMGDAKPALGIVAAVFGIIVTMGSITEPPEILGGLIGAALVGTFAGIFLSYGFISPMGNALANSYGADASNLSCMKTAIIGHMQGYAPQISVEFARKSLPAEFRPTFAEVEEMIGNLPT